MKFRTPHDLRRSLCTRRRRWLIELRRRPSRRLKLALQRRPETVITAPGDLSLSRNGASVLSFLEQIRQSAESLAESQTRAAPVRGRPRHRPQVYIDLTKIRRLSIPAAVVLSAELQKWGLLGRVTPMPKRMSKWAPSVRRLLQHLGTFALLGIRRRPGTDTREDEALVILQLRSGVQTEPEKMAALQDDLRAMGLAFESKAVIFEGLSEGVLNAVEHAYPQKVSAAQEVAARGHHWWATSCYDPDTDCLRFFVYDQGVGIRQTLDRKDDWRPLIDGMKALVGLERSDKDVIAAAFEIGRSRMNLQGRGKGLDQMASVARNIPGGMLRVISGSGVVETDGNGSYDRRGLGAPLLGTLIEWRLPYASLQER